MPPPGPYSPKMSFGEPIEFVIGENTGAAILEAEMAKLDACRILSLDVDKWGRTTCYDDMSGDVLSPELVAEARKLEVKCLKNMKVYDIMSRAEFTRQGRGKLIKVRWLDVNKGDSTKPDIISRYVGKESPPALMRRCSPILLRWER